MGDDTLIAVSELIAQLRHDGLCASEDSLQRLRDHDLIPKPKSMGRLGGGYRPAQVAHIRRALVIQKDLGEKWAYEELAFWMAAWKLRNVPAPLVATHIERSTILFFNGLQRLADRSATGRRTSEGPPARKMARFAARQLIDAANAMPTDAQIASMENLLQFIINLFYFQRAPSALSSDLRRLIYQVYEGPDADSEFMSWQKRLSEDAALFSKARRPSFVNHILTRALNRDPNIVLRSAHDALQGSLALRSGLAQGPMQTVTVSRTNEYLYKRAVRYMIPAVAEISVEIQLKDSRNPHLLRLRRGEDLGFSAFFASIPNKTTSSSKE